MSINVEQTLRDRFAAPLPDNYKRRIIFLAGSGRGVLRLRGRAVH